MLYPGSFILTSTMYPVEAEEAAVTTPPMFGAVLWGMDRPDVAIVVPGFTATHLQTQFPASYPLLDALDILAPVFSGTHVQTYFPRAYAENENAAISPPVFSATYVQTFFPLSYLMESENAAVTPPAFTGSLV